MALPPIDFSDYHRTVIGYHGTRVKTADRLVAGEAFDPSDEEDEWFGKGIYFWEHAFQQAWWWARRRHHSSRLPLLSIGTLNIAWWWARRRHHSSPAVIGAIIRLGYCFDLVDTGNVNLLRLFHDKMIAQWRVENLGIPRNVRSHRMLDCAVFNYMYDEFLEARKLLDTARAVFDRQRSPNEFTKGVGSVKKRTSKSASATPKASSQSGTSEKTGATEGTKVPKPPGKFDFMLARLESQTTEDTRKALIRAGIITETGELTEHYKPHN